MKQKKYGGFCCPALHLAVSRASYNMRTGIMTGTMFSAKGRVQPRPAVVIYFPKAKKGDESEYGFKSEFKNTSYGLCKFCPFCGAKLEEGAKYPGEVSEAS